MLFRSGAAGGRPMPRRTRNALTDHQRGNDPPLPLVLQVSSRTLCTVQPNAGGADEKIPFGLLAGRGSVLVSDAVSNACGKHCPCFPFARPRIASPSGTERMGGKSASATPPVAPDHPPYTQGRGHVQGTGDPLLNARQTDALAKREEVARAGNEGGRADKTSGC